MLSSRARETVKELLPEKGYYLFKIIIYFFNYYNIFLIRNSDILIGNAFGYQIEDRCYLELRRFGERWHQAERSYYKMKGLIPLNSTVNFTLFPWFNCFIILFLWSIVTKIVKWSVILIFFSFFVIMGCNRTLLLLK